MGQRPPIQILQRFRSKYLGIIPWYVTSDILYHDLNMYRDEIRRFIQKYADTMKEHPNIFITTLMKNAKTPRRLKKRIPQDLCI